MLRCANHQSSSRLSTEPRTCKRSNNANGKITIKKERLLSLLLPVEALLANLWPKSWNCPYDFH